MKDIYVVLTKSKTWISRAIGVTTNDFYTHAAISFQKDLTPMYGFSRKFVYSPLPANIQKEYLEKMVARFGATAGMLTRMFSIAPSTLYTHRQKFFPDLEIPKGATKRQIDSFERWLNMESETPVETPEETPQPIPEPVVVERKPERVPEPLFVNTITSGTFELTGRAVDISQTLFRMFQDTKISLKMEFIVLDEEETVVSVEDENGDCTVA